MMRANALKSDAADSVQRPPINYLSLRDSGGALE
jgi:hypothetical protein